MESVESRREQSKGSASHGGGKVCRHCGWVYPNAHPSKKHRKAHQKQCGAAAPVPSVGADDAAGTADVGETPCGQSAEECSLEKSGEALVDELMMEERVEAENMKSTDRPGGDGEDFKDAVLRTENFDNSPKPSVHHSDMVQNSDAETISSHADDSAYIETFPVPCVAYSVCITEDSECASQSASNYKAVPEVIKDLAGATTQNVKDSAAAVNYLGKRNYVHDRLDDVIPNELIPSNDSCCNYSLTNTELENIEEYMESSVTVNQASEVNMLSDLPHRLSANKMGPDLDIYNAQIMKTEVAGQLSQHQPSCQDGPLALKSNTVELVDSSTHSSGYKSEISTFACFQADRDVPKDPHSSELASTTCLVDASDMKPQSLETCRLSCQDGKRSLEKFGGELFDISTQFSGCKNQTGIPDFYPVCDNEIEGYHSSTLAAHPVEDSKWKPGSVEDSALAEPELTKAHENIEVGNELSSHLVDEPSKLAPPKLVVVEFDSNANTLPLTYQTNGDFSFHTEKISSNENSESNNDQICNSVNGDISQLVDELEHRVGMPMVNFQGPEGEVDQPEKLKQVATAGSPVDQAMCLDDPVSSSFETYYLSTDIETNKLEPLWEEQDAYLSCDNNLSVVDSGAVSHISQSCVASLISSQSQIDGNDAIQVNNDVVLEEKTHGIVKDVSSSVDSVAGILPQWYASLPVRRHDDFGSTELHHDKLHEDISSSYLCSISDYCLDQSDNQELLKEVFKQPADDEETIHHSERRGKTCALENIVESDLPGDQSTSMHFRKDGTKCSKATSESLMEQQNVHEIQTIVPLSSDENNQNNRIVIVIDRNTPEVEKENTLFSMDNEELTTNEYSGVCLCHDGENLKTEESSVSEVDYVQSLIGVPASGSDLVTSDKAGVTSIDFNQQPQVEHVFVESMQLTHSSSGKSDDFVASNIQTVSIQAVLNTFLDEAAPSFGYGSEGSNDDAISSSPSDLLTIKELLTTDLEAEANLQQTSAEQNDTLEETLTLLAEPGSKSVSTENTLVQGSKQEPEGRNINEENAAKVLNSSSGKHVMLKNLLAEAYIDNKQRSSNGRGRGHIALLTSKRNWGLHDGGHSQRPATAGTVPDKCKETFDSQADHGEWNSPARLPALKHRKKKVKGRQSWVPFICCPSVN